MSAARGQKDAVAGARRAMRLAGDRIERARRDLQAQLRKLRRHPDYQRTARASKAGRHFDENVTLAWCLHDSISATLHDCELDKARRFLCGDEQHAERDLARLIREEREDRARFERRAVA